MTSQAVSFSSLPPPQRIYVFYDKHSCPKIHWLTQLSLHQAYTYAARDEVIFDGESDQTHFIQATSKDPKWPSVALFFGQLKESQKPFLDNDDLLKIRDVKSLPPTHLLFLTSATSCLAYIQTIQKMTQYSKE